MPVPVMKGFMNLERIPEEKVTDRITRRIVTGEKEMIAFWKMKAGAHAAAHTHPHEQISWMLSGKMEFRLGSEKRTCGPGDIVVIPSGVEHEAWFPEDTEVIDLWSPPREDFYTGQDTYLRKG
ncbi:MAG: cupin domain-containing protein [Candidatus Rokubacteria bacterium]|nr:cupin domain-containing protein [Candidatus Rokubacteria bacterium]MBI2544494.1 cupin domain-containing protein [Candidatus Rokubacteria bacterium]